MARAVTRLSNRQVVAEFHSTEMGRLTDLGVYVHVCMACGRSSVVVVFRLSVHIPAVSMYQ